MTIFRSVLLISFLLLLFSRGGIIIASKQDNSRNFAKEDAGADEGPPINVTQTVDGTITVDNGFVHLEFKFDGQLIVDFQGRNVIGLDAGFNWVIRHGISNFDTLLIGTNFSFVVNNDSQVEISFANGWQTSGAGNFDVPLDFDLRYVLFRGHHGFYTYAIFSRKHGYDPVDLRLIRAQFRLREDKFQYMVASENIQRVMPTSEDLKNGQQLPYKALITNTTHPSLRGQLHKSSQYAVEAKDNNVHGWISSDDDSPIGFWVISPSSVYRTGGPHKQFYAGDVGPFAYLDFYSTDFVGSTDKFKLKLTSSFSKVYGPIFVYLNSGEDLWPLFGNAQQKLFEEQQKWPYPFIDPAFYQIHLYTVNGRLLINDSTSPNPVPASRAWLGLTPRRFIFDYNMNWDAVAESYQYWTQADEDGSFTFKSVSPFDDPQLFAWVPGKLGLFHSYELIFNVSGNVLNLGDLVFYPLTYGPMVWEIGNFDHSAAEFFVPDPYPNLTSPYFSDAENKRSNSTYVPTTWQIIFTLTNVIPGDVHVLLLSLASETYSDLQIRVNDPNGEDNFHSQKRNDGQDYGIADLAIHGYPQVFKINVDNYQLQNGTNIIYITQANTSDPTCGVMYDYLRFESFSSYPPDGGILVHT